MTFRLVENKLRIIYSKKFIAEFGSIIEELRVKNSRLSRYYYPFFMIRRILYATVLIVLYNNPILQFILIQVFVNTPVCFITLLTINSFYCIL